MKSRWGGRRAQKIRAELALTLPTVCWRCGRIVTEHMAWDVGHVIEVDRDPDSAYDSDGLRVEHARCNRQAGARYGNRKRGTTFKISPTSREW